MKDGPKARPQLESYAPSTLDALFRRLGTAVSWLLDHPFRILAAAAILFAVGAYLVTRLSVDADFSRLIPPDYPSVRALDELRREYGGESEVAVVIQSPSFEANKAFAEALIPRAMRLRAEERGEPYFTHFDYRRDISFLENNALYFATSSELDSLQQFLDRRIRQAKLEANPFYFELDDGDGPTDSALTALLDTYRSFVGKEYPISDDSTTMAIRFYPSGSQTDVGFIDNAYTDLGALVDSLQPAAFHPYMEITLAGRLLRQLMQVQAILRDVVASFGSGVLLLLFMVVLYFSYKNYRASSGKRLSGRGVLREVARTPLAAILIAVPLFFSEAVTFGIAYLAYGALNIMTAALGLVLFGMGIDFGIHFFARYAEERGAGRTLHEAVHRTIVTTGQAITVVAITTAAAFYVLMLADFRGFSQFGFIAGTGILLAVASTLVLTPALLAIFERFGWVSYMDQSRKHAEPAREGSGARIPGARFLIVLGAGAVLLSLLVLPRVAFQYDFSTLEPNYDEYNARRRKVRLVYDDRSTRNPAYILVDDQSEVPGVVAALRDHMEADTLTPTIREVESLQDRFPMTPETQRSRLSQIQAVRETLDSPFLADADSDELDLLRTASGTREPIAIDQVPAFLRERFASKSGEVGRLVIIYSSVGLSHGKASMAFADDVGTVRTQDGRVYHAASTSIVASDMLRLMIREAPFMIALTIALVLLFKWIILRRAIWVAIAFLPLASSFIWMFGVMTLAGLTLNFYNLVVLPTVLGIGDDSGIHMVHRYLEEGRGSIRRVLRSTGEHITVSAVTTMVGFGGLLLSMHPGMRSIGWLAVIGIGLTLVAALVFLPALVQWREDRGMRTPTTAAREAASQVEAL